MMEMEDMEKDTQRMKNSDDESKCIDSNKCGKPINVTNKKRLQTVLLEKRKQRHNFKSQSVIKKQTVLLEEKQEQQNLKSQSVSKKQTVLLEKKQQQNLKSPPVSKKQKTGVKLYECGNLGDTASSCVQRKVVEYPTKRQETGDDMKVGQLEAITNKAVELCTTNKAVGLSNESEPISSPPVLHGQTYANSYLSTPSRKAEDIQRFQPISHPYSFESLSPRMHINYNAGYAPNNLRPNVLWHNHLLLAQRVECQYIQEQRMRERNDLNQNGYNCTYWHGYNSRAEDEREEQPPLPTEPYPYPPPPPYPPAHPHHTEPYWDR